MKSIRDSIVYIQYQNRIDKRQNKLLLQDLLMLKDEIKERKLKGIYISLKDTLYDVQTLKELIHILTVTSIKLKINLSLGDYDPTLFKILKDLTKLTYIKLFPNQEIAKLFLNPSSFKKKLKILLAHDEDSTETDKQSCILGKFEHSIIYATNNEDFENQVKKSRIDFAVSQCKINQNHREKSTKDTSTPEKRNFNLSRAMIGNLPTFIDTAVDTLVTITALEAKKLSHGIKPFYDNILDETISSVMKFNGDLDGSFILIFPNYLAKKAIEAMLGESLEDDNTEEIMDGIGEFCNIITGSTKTHLAKKNINVIFELPKTSVSLNETKALIAPNNGIWIDMELSDEPFYMFIVK